MRTYLMVIIMMFSLTRLVRAQERNAEGGYIPIIPDSFPVPLVPEGKTINRFLSENLDTENACLLHSCAKIIIECHVTAEGKLENFWLRKINDTHYLPQIPGLMEKMKYWKPAKKNGEAIDCKFVFPIYIYLK